MRRILEMHKVAGLENPADFLTKYLTRERIDAYSDLIGYRFEEGRAQSTAQLHSCRGIGHMVQNNWRPEVSERLDLSSCAEPPEAKRWQCLSKMHWRGSFRNARSHRSPAHAGVRWQEVSRMLTTDLNTGQVLSDIMPAILGRLRPKHVVSCRGLQTLKLTYLFAPVRKLALIVQQLMTTRKASEGPRRLTRGTHKRIKMKKRPSVARQEWLCPRAGAT